VNDYPVKPARRRPSETGENAGTSTEQYATTSPFFSFRYSYVEISATGRRARVKAKHARYENGKLASESFEGELDRSVYERVVGDAQQYFLGQAAAFARLAAAFLPHPWNDRSKRD
jgi:hypothetical protein